MRDSNGSSQTPSIQEQNPDHEKSGAPNRAPIESVMSILQFLADHLTNIGKHGTETERSDISTTHNSQTY